MQNATTFYPPITPAWTNLAATSQINKLDLSSLSADDQRLYDSSSPQSDCLVIDDDRFSSVSNASTLSSTSSSTLPPKKRYMQTILENDSNKENDIAGKVAKHKCRRCSFVATTKNDYFTHLRTHIRPDKLHECPKCPFVTDNKRHFKYHAFNHINCKPFKCQICDYSGASKSMLDSHLKSHSAAQPYRCGECEFASKFRNKLRKHLDKTGHAKGLVLKDDGSSKRGARISGTSTVRIDLGNGKTMPIVLPTAAFYYEPVSASATVRVDRRVQEEPKESSRLSPSNRQAEIQTIDLTDESSMPLDLSKKNEAAGSPVNAVERAQQQIQYLRANLDNMHQYLWNFEQNYLYTSA